MQTYAILLPRYLTGTSVTELQNSGDGSSAQEEDEFGQWLTRCKTTPVRSISMASKRWQAGDYLGHCFHPEYEDAPIDPRRPRSS